MRVLKYLLLGLLLVCVNNDLFSQNIPPEIVSITENGNSFVINFNLPYYQIADTNTYTVYGINQNYQYINVPNECFGETWDVGYPLLPQLTINISIPEGANGFSVFTTDINSETIPINDLIYPSQEDVKDSLVFIIDENFYNSNGSTYPLMYHLSDPYIIMGKEGISLTLFPFQYNPLIDLLTIINSGTFTISFTPPSIPPNTNFSEVTEIILENFFQNYQISNSDNGQSETYLIITPERFENTLKYFANYKRNLGYDVTVVTTETIGTTKENIKLYIYNTRPFYVLLVGDINFIPTYGTIDGSEDYDPTTDLEYTLLEGNDYFPEACISRLSVSDEVELQSLLNKTIFMETNMKNLGNNAKFLAGIDESNNWMSRKFEEGHDYVIENRFQNYSNEKIYAYSLNSTYDDGVDALSDDPIFFIYSGHGDFEYLGGPYYFNYYYYSEISNRVHNTYPLGFSYACYTGNFGISECYGETWIRDPHGGVSYFGCSVHSLVKPDYKLEKSMFQNIPWLGPMVVTGKNQFWQLYHTTFNNERWKRYMKSYNLLGDPSFDMWGIECFDDLILSNFEHFNCGDIISYNAINMIIAAENPSSSFILENGAVVSLKAGNKVIMKPGFHSKLGCSFLASIDPCNSDIVDSFNNIDTTSSTNKLGYRKIDESNDVPRKVTIYPNPFTDHINLEYQLNSICTFYVEIINSTGQTFYTEAFTGTRGINNQVINLSHLPSGLYILKAHSNDFIESKVIIKSSM